jgi:hypothetical protein
MARIRTIKPEFPQSETIGRLSRDARLLFIQLWTLADDDGRLRAASRMLASLLYPYDDDAPNLIDGWLLELEKEDCITCYQHENTTYLQIDNWHKHQKIQHPTPSKIPGPTEDSVILVNAHEGSEVLQPRARALDLGPRTKEGEDISDTTCPHPPSGGDTDEIPGQMAEIWIAELGDILPKPRKLDRSRRAKLNARFRDTFGQNLEEWRQCCQRIRGSPHLIGENDRAWKADLDFCLEPRKLNRILEGFYDARQSNGRGTPNQRHETLEQQAARLAAEHSERICGRDG